jgi:hypothetical protein
MTTKGNKLSTATKFKISLANQKDRTELHAKLQEYIQSPPDNEPISILNAAIHAQISESALLHYEARTAENSEIRQLLTQLRDLSKSQLITKGLKKEYDTRLTGKLLEYNHNMKTENPNLTQNNIFNVSPEILAEALELSKKK